MKLEIERKFLVKDMSFKKSAVSSRHLVQGYICRDNGSTVRIRMSDDKGMLTIKGPASADGLSRLEWETEIKGDDALKLMQLCRGGIVEKTRWIVKAGKEDRFFEVDEFLGDNSGLVVAEIELGTGSEEFEKPAWLGKEVTGDKKYYNSMLSLHPYRLWDTKE